jgi:hypothetical protein
MKRKSLTLLGLRDGNEKNKKRNGFGVYSLNRRSASAAPAV